MLKIGLEIKENVSSKLGTEVDIKLIDPTKKQLSEATDIEKIIAQKFKNIFDKELMNLLNDKKRVEEAMQKESDL